MFHLVCQVPRKTLARNKCCISSYCGQKFSIYLFASVPFNLLLTPRGHVTMCPLIGFPGGKQTDVTNNGQTVTFFKTPTDCDVFTVASLQIQPLPWRLIIVM